MTPPTPNGAKRKGESVAAWTRRLADTPPDEDEADAPAARLNNEDDLADFELWFDADSLTPQGNPG